MTALLAFLSFLLPVSPDLTKEEIQRLVQAGVSDDVIVAYIRQYGPVGPLTAQDLIDLRHENVSEKVLTAMVASSTAPSPSQTDPEEPPVTYSYPWYYPAGYYYDYYWGPYFWWYVGPGHCHSPYYYHGYWHGYPYYPYSLHGYRGAVQPPYHHPVNPPPRPPQVQPPSHLSPRPTPPRPAPSPHSSGHGGHR